MDPVCAGIGTLSVAHVLPISGHSPERTLPGADTGNWVSLFRYLDLKHCKEKKKKGGGAFSPSFHIQSDTSEHRATKQFISTTASRRLLK